MIIENKTDRCGGRLEGEGVGEVCVKALRPPVLLCSYPMRFISETGQCGTRMAAFLVGLKGEGESVCPGGKIASIMSQRWF